MKINPVDKLLQDHAQGYAFIHAKAAEMDEIYEAARQAIVDKIVHHALSYSEPYQGKHLTALLEGLKKQYSKLEEALMRRMEEDIPYVAQSYYFQALNELDKKTAADILGNIDTGRIKYFIEDSYNHIAGRTKKMRDYEVKRLRDLSQEVFREAALTGESRASVSKRLYDKAVNMGNFRFIDSGGVSWNPKSYFNMLGRTVLMNAGRSSYIDGCVKHKCDTVRVTVSGAPCPACAVFENRLLSISGATAGLTTLDEAIKMGLFHPNCTHSLVAVPASMHDRYGKGGIPNSGHKPPPLKTATDKEAWKEYRRNLALSKRKHGPMADVLGIENVNMEKIPARWRNEIEAHLAKLYGDYDNKLTTIGMRARGRAKGSVTNGTHMNFNKEFFSDKQDYIKDLKMEMKSGFKVKIDKENLGLYTPTHEFGHTVFNTFFTQKPLINKLKLIKGDYRLALSKASPKELKGLFLSEYAEKNINEFFTEGFTQYILSSKPSKVAIEIGKFVEKHYGKK